MGETCHGRELIVQASNREFEKTAERETTLCLSGRLKKFEVINRREMRTGQSFSVRRCDARRGVC
jgi:hypothetical protein